MKLRPRALLAFAGCLWAGAVAAGPLPANGANLSAYASLTTDYRERGLSQSGGDPALLLGLDYQNRTGFFTGLSAAEYSYSEGTYDRANQAERRRPALALRRSPELEVYTGYNWRNAAWSATTAVSRYLYPNSVFDYGYTEFGAGFGFRDRLFVTLSYTPALLARGSSALGAEATFNLPLKPGITLAGTLGRVESDAFSGGGYTQWNLGASKIAGPVTLDLRFYDNDASGTDFYGAPLPNKWVFSVSYGFNAR